jgi:hypothetical protein
MLALASTIKRNEVLKMFEIMKKVLDYMSTVYADEIHVTKSNHEFENPFGVIDVTTKINVYVYDRQIFEIFKDKISNAITSTIDFNIISEFAIEVIPNAIILNYPNPENDQEECVFELHYI